MEDHHVAVIGDWMPPSPSPRTFFSSLLADNNNFSVGSKSILDSPKEYENMGLFLGSQNQPHQMVSEKHDNDHLNDLDTFFGEVHHKGRSRGGGGLVERIAARAGFNAPRLNTESFRSGDLSTSHDIRSPYLTIPPGLSPTTLLDSPVFLSNSLAQPSPTTGKFPFVTNSNNRSSKLTTDVIDRNNDNHFDDINASSFAFKPVPNSGSSFFPGASNNITSATNSQPFPSIENSSNGFHLHPDFSRSTTDMDTGANIIGSEDFNAPGASRECTPLLDEKQDEQGDIKDSSEDVYNWRKYGQKQVKGSEYPRSYYKCTHSNCQVKKKVERSHEGHITEIIYKGAHNHPKPLPNRKSATNPFGDTHLDIPEQGGLQSGFDGDLVWTSTQKGTTSGAPDWRNDEVTPEFCHRSSGMQAQNTGSGDAVDVSSTFSNEEEDDDRGTHGSISLGYDGEGDESESKRRKVEAYASELTGATRAIREPRVVVQTTSEVDILDDGYRWRKYGQKVVKGNPNPRSYYKCTSAGCTVRKHVERASHDLKSVITTYEGKHNHDVPAARNSSHINSSNNAFSQQTAMQRPNLSQIHNSMARYGRQQQQPMRPSHHGFSYGMNNHNQATLGNYAMGMNQYLGQQQQQQQMMMNDMGGFMMPKLEMKMEPISESGHNNNIYNSSSVYQQIMNRLPLGP